jgi:hypothetical protein
MKASDFLKKLEQDPHYQEMQRKKEEELKKRIAEAKEIEAPFIQYLHEKGFTQINDAGELTKSKDNTKLQNIILEWLPKISNKQNSQEILVRALAVTKKPFAGKALMDLFDNQNSSHSLKWAIGNTIACSTVVNISEWLENKLKASEQPTENQMLVYAAIKYFNEEKAKTLIKNLFNHHPLQVTDAITYFGNKDDIDFLLEKRKDVNRIQRTQIDKAIKKLSKKI